MHYNYVVFGSPVDYYVYGYSDLNKTSYSKYYSEPLFTKGEIGNFARIIRKLHMTPRIKKYLNLPFKPIWNSFLFNSTFNNNNPICFIFFSSGPFTSHIKYGFIDYLKRKHKNSKFVVFYQDLVNSNDREISINEYKSMFDFVISFDYNDCKLYDILYHPLVYSDINKKVNHINYSSDIYYCGAAKNRLEEIINAYNWFKKHGFICDFNIITKNTIEKEMCSQIEGIKVFDKFSYYENLQHIKSCKYILEIMQKGGTGYTIRACEAIAFNKKLVSNNKFLKRAPFYNPQDIIDYDNISQLNIDRFDLKTTSKLRENLQSISPISFINFIEKLI